MAATSVAPAATRDLSQKRGLGDDSPNVPAPKKRVRTEVYQVPARSERTPSPTPAAPQSRGPKLPADTRAVFRQYVHQALDEKAAGKPLRYEELRRKFQAHPADSEVEVPSSRELQQTLAALTAIISRLGPSHSALVDDIVNTPWVGRDASFVNVYVKFLGTLVSAHTDYINVVTKMLVEHLVLLPSKVGKLPGYPVVKRGGKQGIYERVHYALQYILQLVPTAGPSTLFPALVTEYPYVDESKLAHITYLRNLLRVIDYQKVLRKRILAVVTDKIIKLDIEIQVFLEDLSDEKLDEFEAEIYAPPEESKKAALAGTEEPADIEDESDDPGEDQGGQGDQENKDHDPGEEREERDSRIAKAKETALKLDTMLDMLFEYYSLSFSETKYSEDAPPSRRATEAFEMIQDFFNITILPTYKSRFTQFLVFWAAQKSPVFVDDFCVTVLGKALDNTCPQNVRQAAANYIGGFVSRARNMDAEQVQTAVAIMCRWLSEFVDQRSIECTAADVTRWGAFYAVVQAVMYIFCFRWRDLRVEEEDEFGVIETRWSRGLEVMQKVIYSRFNPLKVCAWPIVESFAEIAAHFQFLFCHTIIEQNRRTSMTKETDMLDTYFPFDPYKLARSRRWIDDCYIEWQPVEGLHDSDSESDSEDEGRDDDAGDEDEDAEDESSPEA